MGDEARLVGLPPGLGQEVLLPHGQRAVGAGKVDGHRHPDGPQVPLHQPRHPPGQRPPGNQEGDERQMGHRHETGQEPSDHLHDYRPSIDGLRPALQLFPVWGDARLTGAGATATVGFTPPLTAAFRRCCSAGPSLKPHPMDAPRCHLLLAAEAERLWAGAGTVTL